MTLMMKKKRGGRGKSTEKMKEDLNLPRAVRSCSGSRCNVCVRARVSSS